MNEVIDLLEEAQDFLVRTEDKIKPYAASNNINKALALLKQQPEATETKGTCLSCGGSFFVDEQVHIGCVHTRCYWQNKQQPEPVEFVKVNQGKKCKYINARCEGIEQACVLIDRQAADNKRLKGFALNLVDGDEEELKKLDYWAEEYLHAYEQLTKINEIEGKNERLKEHFDNIVLKLCPECLSVIRSIWERAKKGESDG